MKKVKLFLLFICLFCVACNNNEDYMTMGADEAYYVVNSSPNVIVLDTRNKEDFDLSHLDNAINIEYDDLNKKRLSKYVDGYDAYLLVYSYNEYISKNAVLLLNEIGYKNVYTFGGLDDWKYNNITK